MQENELRERIESVQNNIVESAKRAGREVSSIQLIGVTKLKPSSLVQQAYACGLQNFGENYLQEAEQKIESLKNLNICWHFIGRLQTKKIKSIVKNFSWIHSIDKISQISEIEKRAENKSIKVLLQVNLAGETSKGGLLVDEVPAFLEQAQSFSDFQICGLMAMPPLEIERDKSRGHFSRVQNLSEKWQSLLSGPHHLKELSMGTTHDYELAIEEGATMVRVGTQIFGER